MGFDVHSIKLMESFFEKRKFGEVITLGKQSIVAPEFYLKKYFNGKYHCNDFVDSLLVEKFGAESVESVDVSAYQDSSVVHDMNHPIDSKYNEKYDTLIDGGTLEHIFNVPVALKNISNIVKDNGYIIHMTPANNFCGHGFYQFSAELFYQYYSQPYFKIEKMCLVDSSNLSGWYNVVRPEDGIRLNFRSSSSLYFYCIVRKMSNPPSNYCIQQSDYVQLWNKNSDESKDCIEENRQHEDIYSNESLIIDKLKSLGVYSYVRKMWSILGKSKSKVKSSHPYLEWVTF